MRKVNAIVSCILIAVFLIHGIMGSFMLLGISGSAGKILAWIGIGVLCVHVVIGFLLTLQTLRAQRGQGRKYIKENALFWTRRFSGLALLILLFFHIGLFGEVQDDVYILFPFTTVRLLTQLLFIAAFFVHLLVNIRPLLVSIGMAADREKQTDIYLILSMLLMFMSAAVILYYIGWQHL